MGSAAQAEAAALQPSGAGWRGPYGTVPGDTHTHTHIFKLLHFFTGIKFNLIQYKRIKNKKKKQTGSVSYHKQKMKHLAWYMIMSVRNILNQSQLSVFQEAQIFLNSMKTQH